MKHKPPKIFETLFASILGEIDAPSLLGDYAELYHERVETRGKAAAQAWYGFQIMIMAPTLVTESLFWGIVMLKNYLKIAIRNLLKHKSYSVITLSGLAVGMALFILAALYCDFYLSYDEFHRDVERIQTFGQVSQSDRTYLFAPIPMKGVIGEEIPDIGQPTRYRFTSQTRAQYDNHSLL